jgi:UDP-2-acetamido-2-deoxy-ribo-hexuluronate aminotransferase
MQFIDLAAQQKRIREKIEARIKQVLDHGQYIMGPEVRELEEKLSSFVGVKHAIACSSGTDALLMALMAYNVGPGDAVFTTTFTFIATGEVISLLGATPVFVDIDSRTFNLDPNQLEKAIQALKTNDPSLHPLPKKDCSLPTAHCPLTPRGVISVDLFGLPADYDKINAIAKEHDLFVIEDAAQSFGAEYHGRKACSLTEVGCTSFFPAKPLGCYGDGGAVFTDDDALSQRLCSIRIHGKGTDKYDNVRVGINGRPDTLQAAILLPKLEIFPEELTLRQQVAQRYSDFFRPLSSLLRPRFIPEGMKSAWAQYSLLAQGTDHRKAVQGALKQAGIPTAIYYPKPLHLQTAYASLGYKEGDFPISEDCSNRIFSLPMHPYLSLADQERIVASMIEKD